MKIAVVTDDEKTISAHFGRAQYYVVFTVENGRVTGQETRSKANHSQFTGEGHQHGEPGDSHGMDPGSRRRHGMMIDTILDCEVLLARGMGQGAHLNLNERGIKPILTDIKEIREAVDAYLTGKLIENLSRIH